MDYSLLFCVSYNPKYVQQNQNEFYMNQGDKFIQPTKIDINPRGNDQEDNREENMKLFLREISGSADAHEVRARETTHM